MASSRWRRVFRFGLGSLFIALTILCVSLAITANRVRRQQRAVAAILKSGGRIKYETAFQIGNRIYRDNGAQRSKLKAWLGDDWFDTVTGVTLYGEGCNDATLGNIRNLPDVQNLALWAWSTAP